MKTRLLLLAVTIAALEANSASARTEHPRISMQAARASALALVPHGAIRSGELEREHGRLIYSFDIAVPNQTGIEEVQINAMTGRLVSRTHENPAAERQEVRAERREHAPH